MSEMNNEFEQLLEESLVTIHNGEIVEGTVISVKEDEIILNIGYKSDGIVSRNEYTNVPNADLRTMVSVGDTMEVKVLKVNDGEGQVQLSYRRVAAEKGSKRLEEAFENKEVLTAKVSQVLDGGLSVVVDKNAGSLQPIVDGGYAALEAINANHGFLLFCSIGGAILSFIRKMLLV
mgnify:CR=1 FL=1